MGANRSENVVSHGAIPHAITPTDACISGAVTPACSPLAPPLPPRPPPLACWCDTDTVTGTDTDSRDCCWVFLLLRVNCQSGCAALCRDAMLRAMEPYRARSAAFRAFQCSPSIWLMVLFSLPGCASCKRARCSCANSMNEFIGRGMYPSSLLRRPPTGVHACVCVCVCVWCVCDSVCVCV